MDIPVSKLDKPTALACWNLYMHQLTILAENLSQVVISNIGIQITNKNLQEKLLSGQKTGSNRFNFQTWNDTKYLQLYYLGRSHSEPLENSGTKLTYSK